MVFVWRALQRFSSVCASRATQGVTRIKHRALVFRSKLRQVHAVGQHAATCMCPCGSCVLVSATPMEAVLLLGIVYVQLQLNNAVYLPQLPLWRWLLAVQPVQLPAAPEVQAAQFAGQSTQVPLMPTVLPGHVLARSRNETCWGQQQEAHSGVCLQEGNVKSWVHAPCQQLCSR